jgi:hypothetical protein
MPHAGSLTGDDFASTDEVTVYKDEGEDEKRSSENLSEDKLGLVTETEEVGLGFTIVRAQVNSEYGVGPIAAVRLAFSDCNTQSETFLFDQ